MLDARDAEDANLLTNRDYAALFAKYEPVILGRCIARLKGNVDAEDVAQNVMLRIFRELEAGKTYGVPFRVVVHQVTGWTIADYFGGRRTDLPLPQGWEPEAPDEAEGREARWHLVALFESLPERTRRVLELRYLAGLDQDEIAVELEMEPNAVYQALHRGHAKLREQLAHG